MIAFSYALILFLRLRYIVEEHSGEILLAPGSEYKGHSTSNEQIFRNPHALRSILGSCSNCFSVLPNYPAEQFQNLSYLLQIVFQLKLFS